MAHKEIAGLYTSVFQNSEIKLLCEVIRDNPLCICDEGMGNALICKKHRAIKLANEILNWKPLHT